MPSRTSEPSPPPTSWETGWPADTARTPGTRRLWLAGALALVTVAACVTVIALDDRRSGTAPAAADSPSAAEDDGPGLLSFPSSPAATGDRRHGKGPDSGTPATDAPGSGKAVGNGAGKRGRSTAPKPAASSSESGGGGSGAGNGSAGGASGSGNAPAAVRKSVRSVNYPDRYWHISRGLVDLEPVGAAGSADVRHTAVFKLVKGLADRACYSFATADGGYLRHRDFVLGAEHDDGSALFEKDTTFCPRVSSYSGAVMLESVNYPGRFLRHRNFRLELDPYQGSSQFRADSAFRLTAALS
jgi:hypothetical protein